MFPAAGEAATKPTNGAGLAQRFLGISRPGATTICTVCLLEKSRAAPASGIHPRSPAESVIKDDASALSPAETSWRSPGATMAGRLKSLLSSQLSS
jgi:hypothetical protein